MTEDPEADVIPREFPLRLSLEGPGSREEILKYVQSVIEQRTTPHDDTSAERLANGIVTSVLHRLGAGYPLAVGAFHGVLGRLEALEQRVRELEQAADRQADYEREMRERE